MSEEDQSGHGALSPEAFEEIREAARRSGLLTAKIYEHVGRVVRAVTTLETDLTHIIANICNRDHPEPIVRIMQGRRVEDLIDSASAVLPDYTDKGGFLKVLRELAAYRDLVTHADDDLNLSTVEDRAEWRTLVRQRRRAATRFQVDHVSIEKHEEALSSVALGMFIILGATRLGKHDQFSSVFEIVSAVYTGELGEAIPVSRPTVDRLGRMIAAGKLVA